MSGAKLSGAKLSGAKLSYNLIDGMDQDKNEDVRIVTNIKRRIKTRKTRRKVNEKGYDKVKEKKDEDWTSTGPPVLGTGRICLL